MDQKRRQSCCCCCPYQQKDRRSNHRSQTFECDASRDQCPICKERHCNKKGNIIPHLGACPEFKEMNTDRQKEVAISLKHCLVCLRSKNYKNHTNPCSMKRFYCTVQTLRINPTGVNIADTDLITSLQDLLETLMANVAKMIKRVTTVTVRKIPSWTHKLLPHKSDERRTVHTYQNTRR